MNSINHNLRRAQEEQQRFTEREGKFTLPAAMRNPLGVSHKAKP